MSTTTTPLPQPGPIRVAAPEPEAHAEDAPSATTATATTTATTTTDTDRNAMYWHARARLVAAHAEEARCLALGAMGLLASSVAFDAPEDREKAVGILAAITKTAAVYADLTAPAQLRA
jgi:hypothetical protein